jgi:drug/metabolite transporter (DMT)-like permease
MIGPVGSGLAALLRSLRTKSIEGARLPARRDADNFREVAIGGRVLDAMVAPRAALVEGGARPLVLPRFVPGWKLSQSATSTVPARPAVPEQSPMAGIGLKIASVCVFLGMSSLLKASGDVPAGELVFFRSLFAIIPIVVFLAARGQLRPGVRTQRPLMHLLRGAIGTTSMACSFYALTKLPLPESITINYATPLLIVVFGALFAGETVRLYRWSAVIIGFCGVAVIVAPDLLALNNPSAGDREQVLGVIAGLAAVGTGATVTLVIRNLVQTERPATVVLYFSITASILGLCTLPFGWVMPSLTQAAMLVSAGICGGIAQLMMNEAYRRADMSVVAPFEYVSLVLSVIVGYFVFAEIPNWATIVGGLIVTGSGLFIIFRERQLGLKRGKARRYQSLNG